MKFTVLPCPFCGKLETLEFNVHKDTKNVNINCNAVKGGCGCCSGYQTSFEAQANYWNIRSKYDSVMIDSEHAKDARERF